MNKKTLISLAILSASNLTYAQNVIFKCTNSEGNILYVNERQTQKDLKCEKTNLAEIDKRTILNKPNPLAPLGASTASAIVQANTISAEQKARDERRLLILKQEFSQEESQLKTVSAMLQNIEKSNDTSQIQKLKEMVNNHNKNLLALKKEIDSISIKPEINLNENLLATVNGPKPPASIGDTKLPVALPNSTTSNIATPVINNNTVQTPSQSASNSNASIASTPQATRVLEKTSPVKPVEKITARQTQEKSSKTITPQFGSKKEISPSDFLSGK